MRALALFAALLTFEAFADPVPFPRRPKCVVASFQNDRTTCVECTGADCASKPDAGMSQQCVELCETKPCVEVWCTRPTPKKKSKD